MVPLRVSPLPISSSSPGKKTFSSSLKARRPFLFAGWRRQRFTTAFAQKEGEGETRGQYQNIARQKIYLKERGERRKKKEKRGLKRLRVAVFSLFLFLSFLRLAISTTIASL